MEKFRWGQTIIIPFLVSVIVMGLKRTRSELKRILWTVFYNFNCECLKWITWIAHILVKIGAYDYVSNVHDHYWEKNINITFSIAILHLVQLLKTALKQNNMDISSKSSSLRVAPLSGIYTFSSASFSMLSDVKPRQFSITQNHIDLMVEDARRSFLHGGRRYSHCSSILHSSASLSWSLLFAVQENNKSFSKFFIHTDMKYLHAEG